ncbi:MAG: C40 family peptidase [Dysgonomonas sp.]
MFFKKIVIITTTFIILFFSSAAFNKSQAQTSSLFSLQDVVSLSQKLGVHIAEDSKYLSLYKEAAKWIGTRYRRGGTSFSGVDCSGFTGNIYKAVFDKNLDRRSSDIANSVTKTVDKDNLKTGDLVFFSTSRGRKGINHVGVYLNDNKFVHASCGKGVMVSSLDEPYYKRTWRKGGRMNVEEVKSNDIDMPIRFQPDPTLNIKIPFLRTPEAKKVKILH